jgi:hypothetical protein
LGLSGAADDPATREFPGFPDTGQGIKVDETCLVIQTEIEGAISPGIAHNRRVVTVIMAESKAVTDFMHQGKGQGLRGRAAIRDVDIAVDDGLTFDGWRGKG